MKFKLYTEYKVAAGTKVSAGYGNEFNEREAHGFKDKILDKDFILYSSDILSATVAGCEERGIIGLHNIFVERVYKHDFSVYQVSEDDIIEGDDISGTRYTNGFDKALFNHALEQEHQTTFNEDIVSEVKQ